MKHSSKTPNNTQKGWRPNNFARDIGGSLSQVYEWLADGTLPSVKIGGMRIITISPEDFLARFADDKAA